jgi:glutamyl-tRNA synthetase
MLGSLGGVPSEAVPVRVRIAPSPTGYFHVGTARAALFNWLFARQQNGVFVLRIEDTDASRNRAEHAEGIQRSLRWLGLDWDEGPYFQSERAALYADAIDSLVNSGAAYACDCTGEQVRKRAQKRAGPPGYDGYCRERSLEAEPGRLIRFRTPDSGTTSWDDVVRGRVEFPNASIEDFGIRKSNGDPLFILANVVDDADMAISHVVRGEDHVSNTPKYMLLWDALGLGTLPIFAHLPLLTNDAGKKLSKRRDKVAVEDYRDEGYLPEAVRNYLGLLGWSPPGDREIVSVEEMIADFRLEEVKRAPAVFDERKMQSVNAEYIRRLDSGEFVDRAGEWLRSRWSPLAPLVQERARTLAEVYAMVDFLYLPAPSIDAREWAAGVRRQPAFGEILEAGLRRYSSEDLAWTPEALRDATLAAGEDAGVPQLGKSQAPIRLAVTGRSVGPPLFESLALLGRDRTLERLRAGVERATGGAATP